MRYVVGDYKRGGIKGAYHWVRCHAWNRYHLIDIRGHGGYDWGWIDRDEAMLIACFAILCEYVEKEDPSVGTRTLTEWVTDEWSRDLVSAQVADEVEIRTLYEWWKRGRKADQDAIEAIAIGCYSGPGWDEYKRLSEAYDAKDDAMLARLLKVRGRLWT